MKPSSGDDISPITILLDAACIRCDRQHVGKCTITDSEWHASDRCKDMKSMTSDQIIDNIRLERASRILGGKS